MAKGGFNFNQIKAYSFCPHFYYLRYRKQTPSLGEIIRVTICKTLAELYLMLFEGFLDKKDIVKEAGKILKKEWLNRAPFHQSHLTKTFDTLSGLILLPSLLDTSGLLDVEFTISLELADSQLHLECLKLRDTGTAIELFFLYHDLPRSSADKLHLAEPMLLAGAVKKEFKREVAIKICSLKELQILEVPYSEDEYRKALFLTELLIEQLSSDTSFEGNFINCSRCEFLNLCELVPSLSWKTLALRRKFP